MKIAKLISIIFILLILKNSYAIMTKKVEQDWLQEEHIEKQKLLESFYQEHIVNYNQKSVDSFKKFIINSHFPKDALWQVKMENLFQDVIDRKIDFNSFSTEFDAFPLVMIRQMNEEEHLVPENKFEEIKPHITNADLKIIQNYIQSKGISSSITLGNADKKLITPHFPENLSQYPFAIHSVGKVFTGILTFIMIREGVITEDDLQRPIQLSSSVLKKLSPAVQEQLTKVTLYQIMTHQAGLGDYLGKYCKEISDGHAPIIQNVEDFIPFIDADVYPIGKERYSNAGILLVGLAIEYAYNQKYHLNKDYNEILNQYIINPAGLSTFSPWKPENARYNLADPIAPQIVGSPGGGYWTTSQDLAKFGQWIYQKAHADPQFQLLIEKYGQEFYHADRGVIAHGGGIPSSNAFLSVSLRTGSTIAILSDQPPGLASDLNAMIQEHIFSKEIRNGVT